MVNGGASSPVAGKKRGFIPDNLPGESEDKAHQKQTLGKYSGFRATAAKCNGGMMM